MEASSSKKGEKDFISELREFVSKIKAANLAKLYDSDEEQWQPKNLADFIGKGKAAEYNETYDKRYHKIPLTLWEKAQWDDWNNLNSTMYVCLSYEIAKDILKRSEAMKEGKPYDWEPKHELMYFPPSFH